MGCIQVLGSTTSATNIEIYKNNVLYYNKDVTLGLVVVTTGITTHCAS